MLPFEHTPPAGKIVAYIDGGARGNPGPAGFGVRVEEADGTLIEEFAESIGTATNNVAEYRALLAALEWTRRHGRHQLHVRSDSLLLVQQMLGNYKVKNAGLQPLHARARVLAHEIGRVTFEHVGRSLNAHADRLANSAMDDAAPRSVFHRQCRPSGLPETADLKVRTHQSHNAWSAQTLRIAAAIRPAPTPSRRYEQNRSG